MGTGKIVYIIGFMGSGKSTAGKRLASLLGWAFLDLDKEIEAKTGMSIPELFSTYGEPYFRNVESSILKNICSSENLILSTGGGAPCNEDNMDFMIETGLTVYLKLTPAQLKSRLADSAGERPLLKDLRDDDLLDFITEKLEIREKWYNRAVISINGLDLDINSLRKLIIENLNI